MAFSPVQDSPKVLKYLGESVLPVLRRLRHICLHLSLEKGGANAAVLAGRVILEHARGRPAISREDAASRRPPLTIVFRGSPRDPLGGETRIEVHEERQE